MNVIAIIPARGGSKGIPRKNVLPLAGKPLIAWTIEAARGTKHVQRVIVSTDDAEIAEVAKRFGAEVVMRPAELSGDTASSEAALLHVLDYLETHQHYVPDITVFLQCTSPLTSSADIDGTIEAMMNEQADTAVAVTPFHYFLWRKNEHGDTIGINHDKRVRPMRQQREPQYLETGAVYVMKTAGFRHAKHRFFGKTAMHETPPERRWEIDDPVDFKIAEMLLRENLVDSQISLLPVRVDALVMDFDGVFTDNNVIVRDDGHESVVCNRSDGWGLSQLKKCGVPLLVISTEQNPVVTARCRKLGIECLQGIHDKSTALKQWAAERNFALSNIVFIGNDVNDLDCLGIVGCPVVVADAYPEAMQRARLILQRPGGKGALRELADLIQKKYNQGASHV